MSNCLTCTKSTLGDDLVLAIGANREVQKALCKYFWFDEEEYLERELCYPCWHQIEDFHRFYCKVRKLYARPMCCQVPTAVKLDPVDFVLEVPAEQAGDCMVAESGGIYSIKYENPQVDVAPESTEQPSEYIEAEADGKDAEENDTDVARPSKKRGTKRPRLRKNEKDAVQEYVSRNLTLNCDTCSERSDTFELLQRHSMMEHAKHATVVCCNSRFSDGRRFVKHIHQHLNPKLFRCDYCFQQCISRAALKKHVRMNHSANKDSSMKVPEEIELSVMRTEVVDDGPSGTQKSGASEDMNSSEDEGEENDDDSRKGKRKRLNRLVLTPEEKTQIRTFMEKNRILECETCSERCTRVNEFHNHCMEKHNVSATVMCCNRKFVNNYRLVSHVLHHVNPERFKCTQCSKLYPNWEAVKRHVRMKHTREGRQMTDVDKIIAENYNLQCDTCQKQHDTYQALQRHSTTEHRKPAIVFCCGRKIDRRSKLLDHYQYHQDPNTFMCKICLKTWNHSAALRHHMKYTHPAEWRKIRSAERS